MEWLAILELILSFLGECRESRSRSQVIDSVENLGPFERFALRLKMRRAGVSREDQATALGIVQQEGAGWNRDECEELVLCAEEMAKQNGMQLVGDLEDL